VAGWQVAAQAPAGWGATALHLAACHGHLAIVEALLRYAALDPACATAEGLTALHVAAHVGQAGGVIFFYHINYSLSSNGFCATLVVVSPVGVMGVGDTCGPEQGLGGPSSWSTLRTHLFFFASHALVSPSLFCFVYLCVLSLGCTCDGSTSRSR
jgi:hypothetical protein